MDFEKKVINLAKKLEGKNLRQEWSQNRATLQRDLKMSTGELHRAFALIGPAQEAAKEKGMDTVDILTSMTAESADKKKSAANEAARVKKEAKAEEAKKKSAAKKAEAAKAKKTAAAAKKKAAKKK